MLHMIPEAPPGVTHVTFTDLQGGPGHADLIEAGTFAGFWRDHKGGIHQWWNLLLCEPVDDGRPDDGQPPAASPAAITYVQGAVAAFGARHAAVRALNEAVVDALHADALLEDLRLAFVGGCEHGAYAARDAVARWFAEHGYPSALPA
jgi:hypothetical protein